MSNWTRSDPSQSTPLYASRFCYSDWFLHQLWTGTDRGGKSGDRTGGFTVPEVGSLFFLLCIDTLPLFYKGVFHLPDRPLLASCAMWCKRQQLAPNAYLPVRFHVMPVHITQCNWGKSERRQGWEPTSFHFVIQDFMLIDGKCSQTSATVSLSPKCHCRPKLKEENECPMIQVRYLSYFKQMDQYNEDCSSFESTFSQQVPSLHNIVYVYSVIRCWSREYHYITNHCC